MSKFKKTFWVIFSVFVVSIGIWIATSQNQPLVQGRVLNTYQTSNTRTNAASTLCSGFTRTQLSKKQWSSHIESISSHLGLDGIWIIDQIFNHNGDGVSNQLNNSIRFRQFILTFAIGLAVLIIIFPILGMCCCCPYCCPCCCRKDVLQPFKSSELLQPLRWFSLFLILVIGGSIYGLIATNGTKQSFSQATCSISLLTDDIMNGNTTTSQDSYFMGLNQIPILLEQLRINLNNIDNNITELYNTNANSTMSQAVSLSQTAINDTILISNNDAAGNPLTLNYNTPLHFSVTNSSINSTFPDVLGSTSSQSGMVYSLYSSLSNFEQMISGLYSNAQLFHNNLTQINSGMSTGVNDANGLKNNVTNGLGNVNTRLQDSQQGTRGNEIFIPIYWGSIIFFSILCILTGICAYKSNKDCCRYLMYFSCFFIFLLTLIGFIVSTAYSVALPFASWSCEYYNSTISSQNAFQSKFMFYVDHLYRHFDIDTLQKIGVCMPYRNGNIYQQLTGTTNYNYFNSMMGIFTDLNNFNLTTYFSPINAQISTTLTTTSQYSLSKLMDITDNLSLIELEQLATPSSISANCNSNIGGDSYVPSNHQSQQSSFVISCTVGGNQGNSSTCSSGLSSTNNGCFGCMDSTQVLYRYLTQSVNALLTDLLVRYGSTCTFSTKLNNVWNNYYKVKMQALGPTVGGTSSTSGVYPRVITVQTDVNNLNNTVDPHLTNIFSTINTNLASINSLTNPVYGVLGGMNCSVVGQDATRIKNTACGDMIDHMYMTRLVMGIVSYCMLLALCFIVCFGNRHARKRQEDKTYGNDDVFMYPAQYSADVIKNKNINDG